MSLDCVAVEQGDAECEQGLSALCLDRQDNVQEYEHCKQFILLLGEALHCYGASSQSLEDALVQLAKTLSIHVEVLSTPTSMIVAFERGGGAQDVMLLRVEPGGVDLSRLCQLNEVAGEVTRGDVSLEQGVEKIDDILGAQPEWGAVHLVLASVLSSLCVARFLSATWYEVLCCAVLGGVVGGLGLWMPRSVVTARLYEPVAALLVGFVSALLAAFFSMEVSILLVSALIVLVPGFTLTIAIKELATRNLVSGASRSFGAFLIFLELGFGVFVGQKLAAALGEVWSGHLGVLERVVISSSWTELIALVLAPVALSVLFQARKQDLFAMCVSGVIAYVGSKFGRQMLGAEVGAFLGALGVGCCGNLLARMGDRPATALQIPGVIMLVPGSVGFVSVTALLEQDVTRGVQVGFGMMMIAISIVAGLLVADALISSRKVF